MCTSMLRDHLQLFFLDFIISVISVQEYKTGNGTEIFWRVRKAKKWNALIHIIITVLDIIHSLVFYLKLNSTAWVCPYLTGNTLRLHYEPNRLMLYIGLRQLYIIVTVILVTLDITCRPVFYLKQDTSETGFCLRLQVEAFQLGHIDGANLSPNLALPCLCLSVYLSVCLCLSVCPFVSRHIRTRNQSFIFSQILIFVNFTKICWRNPIFILTGQHLTDLLQGNFTGYYDYISRVTH
jgi:hypothetical protein